MPWKDLAARCSNEMDDSGGPWNPLAARASLYRICDSISLRYPLKPVQRVVLGEAESPAAARRQTLNNSSSCCLKARRQPGSAKVCGREHLKRHHLSWGPPPHPHIHPAGAGHCFNQSEGDAPDSCGRVLMEGSRPAIPDMIEMTALRPDTVSLS